MAASAAFERRQGPVVVDKPEISATVKDETFHVGQTASVVIHEDIMVVRIPRTVGFDDNSVRFFWRGVLALVVGISPIFYFPLNLSC